MASGQRLHLMPVAIGRSWRSLRHHHPSQVAYRGAAIGKRLLWRVVGGPRIPRRPAPHPSARPPLPLFAPQQRSDDHAQVPGASVPLQTPIQWEAGLSQLGLFHLHYHDYLLQLPDPVAAAVMLDWIEANPPSPAASRYAWSPYVVSVRTVAWMQLLAQRPGLLPHSDAVTVRESLAGQLRYLAGNLERDLGGNHLVKNVRALAWAGAFFRGPEPHRWRSTALRLLGRILADQILSDGMHFERSPAYHLQVLADLLECRAVLPTNASVGLDPALTRMARVAADLCHPDGLPSGMADGGLNLAPRPARLLAALTDMTGVSPPDPSPWFSYPVAGYHGVRHDRLYLLIDCGPIGADHLPAHGHGDILSFELSVDGSRFIVDPGVFEYAPGEWREWSRSTLAHNTIALDGQDQAEFWSSFRVGRRPQQITARVDADQTGFVLKGQHDGYRHLPGRPLHRRQFTVTSDSILIVDEVGGGAGQAVSGGLLLHPEVETAFRDGEWILSRSGSRVRVSTTATARREDAQYAPDLGVKLPTSRLTFDFGPAPTRHELRILID